MEFKGKLDGKDGATNSKLRIRLDADKADIQVGGNGSGGDIEIRNDSGNTRIRLEAGGTEAPVLGVNPGLVASLETILLSGEEGTIKVGGPGQNGHIRLRDSGSKERIHLDAEKADIAVGGNGRGGDIWIKDDANAIRIHLNAGGAEAPGIHATEIIELDAVTATINAGGRQTDGSLVLRGRDNKKRIQLDATGDSEGPSHSAIYLDGANASIHAGGEDLAGGNIFVRSKFGLGPIHLRGDNAEIIGGRVTLKSEGQTRIRFDAQGGNVFIGGNGSGGDLLFFKSSGDNVTGSQASIYLSGDNGTIAFQNGDCAEDFQIEDAETVEPGTVLTIGEGSRLQVGQNAYDKRVAGVVAGAGECRPGIILGRKDGERKTSLPVALMGRVYCKVDSSYASVEVGDLLTTSPTPGHAMKASDPLKAFGSVIGKALEPLAGGVGMIPILVALQ